jgi:hypothetical protein
MNVNIGTFLMQCAAMGVWIFLVAGIYAIVEKLLDKHYPGLLDTSHEADNQDPTTAQTPVATSEGAKRA